MPDLKKIRMHLLALNTALENLEKHKNLKIADLKSDLDLLWILERGVYLTIQNLLMMFAHIASSDINREWETYSELPLILSANEIIDAKEKELLTRLIGFRNRLNHECTSVSPEILADIVDNRLDDIVLLRKCITRYCKM